MHQYKTNYTILLSLVFCIILIFSNCTLEPEIDHSTDEIELDKLVHKADSLSAKEVYDIALQLNTNVRQDSFYQLLFNEVKLRNDAKGLREHLIFFEKLCAEHERFPVMFNYTLGMVNIIENNLENSIDYYTKGLEAAKAIKDTVHVVVSLKSISLCHDRMGNYNKATKIGLQAISLCEMIHEPQMLADLRLDIATHLFQNKDFDKSIELAQKTIPFYQATNDKLYEAFAYKNIGMGFSAKKDSLNTILYFDKCLALRKELKDPAGLAESYGQYANFWFNRKNYSKSLAAAKEADFWIQKSQFRGMDGGLAAILGAALCKTGSFQAGKAKLEFALNYAKEHKNLKDESQIYYKLYQVHKSANIPIKTLEYYEKHIVLKDSIYTKEKQESINELNIKYETAKKDKELAATKHQQKVDSLTNTLIILVLLGLMATGFALLLRNRGQRKLLKQNNQLLEQDKELAIARELLNLQALKISKEQLTITKQELEEANKLVELKNKFIETLEMQLNEEENTPKEQSENPSIVFRTMKILTDEQWIKFQEQYEAVFPNVQTRIKIDFPAITAAELRLFLLTRLQFDAKEIAETLGISKASVYRSRQRLSKKLETLNTSDLDAFIAAY